jgi:NAD(P)-dependent dehydrogenase (short-subunit alcohol dehydrogenase family)
MSFGALFRGKGASGFGYGSTAEDVSDGIDLSGQRYLVTGSNSGIGAETARVLALRGATVLCAARSQAKADETARALSPTAIGVACELSEPASVRGCVTAVRAMGEPLAGIICNAGIMALPKLEQKHGYELQFFTNHIGHFALATGLLDLLAGDGRVVVLSSAAHAGAPSGGIEFDNLSGARGYTAWRAYGQAKLANLLFARELARRLPAGQTANSVHPGVIATNLGRHMPGWMQTIMGATAPLFLKSIPEGAATQTWAAVHPTTAALRGEYLADSNVATSSALGRDDALAAKLWVESEKIVAGLAGV